MFKSLFAKSAPVLALGLAGVGLACGAAVTPSSTTFTGTITLTSNQYDDYFVYSANSAAITGIKGAGVTNPFTGQGNFIPAGSYPISETIQSYITNGVATAIGMYSGTGVSVAVNQGVYNAALGKETWDQVFTGTSEASIAAALASGDQATLLSFLNNFSSDFLSFSSNTTTSVSGGILHFSTAADGGSLTFSNITAMGTPPVTTVPSSATPEPSTEMLFGGGLAACALFMRKLRKA